MATLRLLWWRTVSCCILALATSLGAASGQRAEDLVAVVHTSNPVESLTHGELRQIYWMTRREWPTGQTITPYLPAEGSAAEELLRREIFRVRSSIEISKYYLRAIFRQQIISPPERAMTSRDAVARVAAQPGAIALAERGQVASERVRLVEILRLDTRTTE